MTERLLGTTHEHKDYGASDRTCNLPQIQTSESMGRNSMELGQFRNQGFDESKLEGGENRHKDDAIKGIVFDLTKTERHC